MFALKARMITTNKAEINRWTRRRIRVALPASSFSIPRMSTQNEVVSAVRAESALLNAAAMIPIVKNTKILSPNMPDVQNIGRMSSLKAGRGIFCCPAKVSKRTPNDRKRKLTGVNANPYVYMFFWASLKLLHERFFCIMSWSNPVMTIVMKIPLKNCLKKFCVLCQSPNSKIRK